MRIRKGRVIVLTGDGKGKTTAAIGLTLRAIGSGQRVYFAQFLKKGNYSEIKAFVRYSDLIAVEQFGLGRFTGRHPTPEDIQTAQDGLKRVKAVMAESGFGMVVLDEANVAVELGLISVSDLVDLIRDKPVELDLVITGRYAAVPVMENADVTIEMKAQKHYYQKGVTAREGIEK